MSHKVCRFLSSPVLLCTSDKNDDDDYDVMMTTMTMMTLTSNQS